MCVYLTCSYARHLISMEFSTDIITYTHTHNTQTKFSVYKKKDLRRLFDAFDTQKIIKSYPMFSYIFLSQSKVLYSFISPFCKFVLKYFTHQNWLDWWAAWEILCKFTIWHVHRYHRWLLKQRLLLQTTCFHRTVIFCYIFMHRCVRCCDLY